MAHAELVSRPTRWCKQVPVPESFIVSSGSGGLRIEWKWFPLTAPVVMGVATVLLAGGAELAAWFSATDDALVRIATLALGGALSWLVLAVLINRTVVEVSNCALTVRQEPMPCFGNREQPSHELAAILVEADGPSDFALWGQLANGNRRRLVSGLTRSQGLCLEHLIEERLGIFAQTVPGAVE